MNVGEACGFDALPHLLEAVEWTSALGCGGSEDWSPFVEGRVLGEWSVWRGVTDVEFSLLNPAAGDKVSGRVSKKLRSEGETTYS